MESTEQGDNGDGSGRSVPPEVLPVEPGDSAKAKASGSAPSERLRPRSPAVYTGGIWVGFVALILALVALAGVAGVGWAWYQMRGVQVRIAELEGRVAAQSARLATVQNDAARQRDLNDLQDRVQRMQVKEQTRAAEMSAALEKLQTRLAGGSRGYREYEAAALMRLAVDRLGLAHDVAGATQALQLADQALAAMGTSGFAAVRLALGKEIAALEAVPHLNVVGVYARLGRLAQRVGSLPLAGNRVAAKAPAKTRKAVGFGWSGIADAFKRAFSPLVVVSHGPLARPLLPPNEAYFVRENLRLALGQAQMALLQRRPGVYRASLERASRWLRDWFDPSAPAVRQVAAAIGQLAQIDLNPKLPQLGSALAKLRALRAATRQ